MKLTEPQKRMLNQVHEAGERTYNGRARRTVEKLEAAGYIVYDYDLIAQTKGNGNEYVERFIVRIHPDLDLTGAGENGLGFPW